MSETDAPKPPAGWEMVAIRRFANVRNGADYKAVEVPEGGYPVYGSGGEFRRASDFLFDGPSVLFGRKGTVDRPLLVSGKFWTVDTMFYTVLSPRVDARFFHYSALTIPFQRYTTGTALPSMTQADIASHKLAMPPVRVQSQIADYLDRETAQIDTLISEQERLIDLLRERRSATVMSMIDGLGAPWDRLGRFARVGNGSTPRRENLEYWSESEGMPWLSSSAVNTRFVTSATQFVSDVALAKCHLPIVEPGSILVGLIGQGPTRGMAAQLSMSASISQNMAYVSPLDGRWDTDFLYWTIVARYRDLRRISSQSGGAQSALTCEDLRSLSVSCPPIGEQREVARALNFSDAKLAELIADSERLIELAKERRSVLITAAVTGQIDVTEMEKHAS